MNRRLTDAVAELDRFVNWEQRDRDARMRRTLAPVRDLLWRMGDPHRRWRAVHVAGTKGKGTTSALVAAGLRNAGLRTGLYTSPHVVRMNERVRIDGVDVEDDVLAVAIEATLSARREAVDAGTAARESTWFDLVTAAAFRVFAEAGVEWAVIECGLGGRLDSTNVVHGEVCIVTNIDLEHTAVLGGTRAAIAAEKAGILDPGSTLVTGVPIRRDVPRELDPGAVLADHAAACGADVLRPKESGDTMFEENVALARMALDELGWRGVLSERGRRVSAAVLDDATVQAARLPGRLERFQVGSVPVVIDGAHVASSVGRVLDELGRDASLPGRPVVVLALGRDKDAQAILKMLHGRADRLLCTSVPTGPLRAADLLAAEAAREGHEAETASEPAQALARAIELAGRRRWVLVIGSFYLAGAIRSQITTDPTVHPK